MKKLLFTTLILCSSFSFGQKKTLPHIRGLRNFMIVGKIDKPEDRYAMEVNLTRFLSQFKFKVLPSLNYSKVGNSSAILASDSLTEILKAQNANAQLLVSVRGYEKNYQPASQVPETLKEALDQGHLFPIYQGEVTSVTFEFTLYVDRKFAGYEIVKVGNVKSRDVVFKRLEDKLEKLLHKWTAPVKK